MSFARGSPRDFELRTSIRGVARENPHLLKPEGAAPKTRLEIGIRCSAKSACPMLYVAGGNIETKGSVALIEFSAAPLMTNFRLPADSRSPISAAKCFAFTIALLTIFIAPNENAQAQDTLATPVPPDWCKQLPRPEYKTLERVLPNEPWFEVYKVAPDTFAIYEPHQSEETIAYLISGPKQSVLFDTGMGIGNLKALVTKLTAKPIVVLNSHTHNDHIGGNWQFPYVFGMDSAFTKANTKAAREDAQAEIAPGQICGATPKGFDPKTYETKAWHVSIPIHDGFKINLGFSKRTLEVIATPGHTPDAICLLDRENGLLFTGDTYYPGPIWLYRPETDLDAYVASVKKIAALAPDLKMVLGAHNFPVAQPSVLPKLVEAIEAVRAGKGETKPAGDGKVLRTYDGFSFLMKADK